jgi:hypothetical protein
VRRHLFVAAVRVGVLALALGSMLGADHAARADDGGEAGLVIEHGDGTTDTYCVAFSGDSISGADLLAKVNIPVTQFGGLVCAVGAETPAKEGCFQPSSFETCACQSYPPTNLYWSFFIQRYGQGWQYASSGYQDPRSALKDGDMQAWRWGKGSPNSAPSPPPINFEQVCAHSPRGGLAATTTVAATVAQPTTAPPAAGSTAAQQPTAAVSNTIAPSLTLAPTVETGTPPPVLTAENTPLITNHGTATATPAPRSASSGSGSSSTAAWEILVFLAIALILSGAIAFALVRRRRHGA